MADYRAEQFEYEEDYAIEGICDNCGEIVSGEDCDEGDCPECGGDLTLETSHEQCECAICRMTFDMWDDGYRHKGDNDILICEDCFRQLL